MRINPYTTTALQDPTGLGGRGFLRPASGSGREEDASPWAANAFQVTLSSVLTLRESQATSSSGQDAAAVSGAFSISRWAQSVRVSLSDSGRLVSSIHQALNAEPKERKGLMARIREAIDNGGFNPAAVEIARRKVSSFFFGDVK